MFNIQNFRILSSIFILIFFVFGLPFISSIALSHENNHLGSTSEFPSYSKLVKKASPAVVNIFTRKAVNKQIPPLFNDPFFQRFFGDRFPRLERERIERSLGSGVIVRPDGLIVTNYHVISGADEIKVVLSDRREFQARVIREDQRSDLAILRIETNDQLFPFIELGDSDELEVGDFVIAIGNPFGVGQTVTSGIISGLARTNVGISDFNFFIQTDAAINPGNSGGALLRMDGTLAGVNTAIFSRSGGSQGIGFAVPANMVRTVVDGASKSGRLQRPWLGADTQNITSEIAEAMGMGRPIGALITKLHPFGPAIRSGIRIGDIITHVDGQRVDDTESLTFRIATRKVGEVSQLSVRRKNNVIIVSFPLELSPETPPRNKTLLKGVHPISGATVVNLSPAVAEEQGISLLTTGVLITTIKRGSPAARIVFRPGDIILRVNRNKIGSVKELLEVISRGAKVWRLAINRNSKILTITVPG
ncbi:MAG: Periplasmic serine endoprotease DegP [Alphaproteobacteria bacterium MarineAlpha12_Bin1]|jgi:serine protease Do|nr:MAG: Periplasmic serine endoprotease DegP [Alphaproteobacteria bacterium MarineAlpha12_Bin1]|tara:strand:- start:28461 stop:29891 length:1431 start_codon:yes stop_codon:yes gene_type:complete